MALDDNTIEKKHYTVKEVSEMFEVKSSLLRFYEKQFDFLQPERRSNNRRFYTQKQIDQLKTIFYLTRDKKYTLEGVKDHFKQQRKHKVDVVDVIDALEELKLFFQDLKKNVE